MKKQFVNFVITVDMGERSDTIAQLLRNLNFIKGVVHVSTDESAVTEEKQKENGNFDVNSGMMNGIKKMFGGK